MSAPVAALALAAAVLAAPAGRAPERLRHLCPSTAPSSAPVGPGRRGGLVPGALPGVAGVLAVLRRRRRPSAEALATVARAADLVAACLEAGLPQVGALEASAAALETGDTPASDAVAAALRTAAARTRLGAGPEAAWVGADPLVGPLTAVLARESGSRAAEGLGHAAARLRSEVAASALARAERAGVLVAGPLGLCFLPAFVALGVVPVVVGLAADVLPAVGG